MYEPSTREQAYQTAGTDPTHGAGVGRIPTVTLAHPPDTSRKTGFWYGVVPEAVGEAAAPGKRVRGGAAQGRRIGADAADEVGIALAQEAEAERIEARHGGYAALVLDLAIGGEHGQVEPWKRTPVSGGPDHGPDAGVGDAR